jgi:hypothetical protein
MKTSDETGFPSRNEYSRYEASAFISQLQLKPQLQLPLLTIHARSREEPQHDPLHVGKFNDRRATATTVARPSRTSREPERVDVRDVYT